MESKSDILQKMKPQDIAPDYAAHCLREAQKLISPIEVLPTPSIKVGQEMVIKTLSDPGVNRIRPYPIKSTSLGSSGSAIFVADNGKMFVRSPKTNSRDKDQLFSESMHGASAAILLQLQAAMPDRKVPGFVTVIGMGQIIGGEIRQCADPTQLTTREAGILVERVDMTDPAENDSRQKLYGLVTYLQGQEMLKTRANYMATDIKGSIKWGGIDTDSGELLDSKVLDIDFIKPITPGLKARHYADQLNWVGVNANTLWSMAENTAYGDSPFAEVLYALAIGADYEFLPETEKIRFRESLGFNLPSLDKICDLLISVKVEELTKDPSFRVPKGQLQKAVEIMAAIKENPLPLDFKNGELVLNFKSKLLSGFGVKNPYGFLNDYSDALGKGLDCPFAVDMSEVEKKWLSDNIPDAVPIIYAEYSGRSDYASAQEFYKQKARELTRVIMKKYGLV